MRLLRALVAVALLVAAVCLGYWLFSPRPPKHAANLAVYYCKLDGETLADPQSEAFYATAQAVAGPPAETSAIRFPAGTVVRAVHVAGRTATVDLGGTIAAPQSGSFAESGEFKALVWTLTSLPGIDAVQVKIGGARVPTLPGGHLELDEPLTRQSW
jgi:spore germination protein GerM